MEQQPDYEILDLGHAPTVPALLAAAVSRHGDTDYVITASDRLTYRQAADRSALLARQLLAAGVGKGTRIGIVLPSGIDFAVAFLAVARIGATAMLFSSTYRPAELARGLRIGDVDTLIAPRVLLGRDYAPVLEAAVDGLAGHGPGPLWLPAMPYLRSIWLVGGSDRAWATTLDLRESWLPTVEPALLAAVEDEVAPADWLLSICTSGSSADPKLVLHTQGATVRKTHPSTGIGLQAAIPDQRVFVAMPFFWVGGPLCLLGSLHTGSPVVAQERFDGDEALELMERERVTIIAGWRARVDDLIAAAAASGRRLALDDPLPFLRSSKGDPVNVGMTETCGPHHNPRFFEYRIVDPQTGSSIPDGEVGEFFIRGHGLTAGIYKREREDTFDVDGWYHTGDRGYLENGRVFFLGRYSEMLKSGGANVAPAEVEQVLLGFPEIEEAYVVGVPHHDLGDEVVAVIVPAPNALIDEEDLRARARQVLSAYKVPRRFVVLTPDDVPRFATGKADKRTIAANVAGTA
ncbi:MAG: class I adenylate-forming enzyme family protein [Acidimicrobiia bacterium]|jgi:acyl-CoA synthetase (AMP-forming)/AMP-acid ligase II